MQQVTVRFLWNKKIDGVYQDVLISSAVTEYGGGVEAPILRPSEYEFIRWDTYAYQKDVRQNLDVYALCIPRWETLCFMPRNELYACLYEDEESLLKQKLPGWIKDEMFEELTSDMYRQQSLIDIGYLSDPNFSSDLSSKTGLSDLKPHNPEYGEYNDEAAANSVINVKNMKIEFNAGDFPDETKTFIQNTVMPYVKHMVPSTTIMSYNIVGEKGNVIKLTPSMYCHGEYSDDYSVLSGSESNFYYSKVNVQVEERANSYYYLTYSINGSDLSSQHPVEVLFDMTKLGGSNKTASFYDGETYQIDGVTKQNGHSTGIIVNGSSSGSCFPSLSDVTYLVSNNVIITNVKMSSNDYSSSGFCVYYKRRESANWEPQSDNPFVAFDSVKMPGEEYRFTPNCTIGPLSLREELYYAIAVDYGRSYNVGGRVVFVREGFVLTQTGHIPSSSTGGTLEDAPQITNFVDELLGIKIKNPLITWTDQSDNSQHVIQTNLVSVKTKESSFEGGELYLSGSVEDGGYIDAHGSDVTMSVDTSGLTSDSPGILWHANVYSGRSASFVNSFISIDGYENMDFSFNVKRNREQVPIIFKIELSSSNYKNIEHVEYLFYQNIPT